ncbi:MAG: hypothetical protein ACMUEM_01250 [Flavobacteriales bacterium AspAUS03]
MVENRNQMWVMLGHMVCLASDPVKIGSNEKPVSDYHMQMLKKAGNPAHLNEEGYIVSKLPLPTGTISSYGELPKISRRPILKNSHSTTLLGDTGYFDQNSYKLYQRTDQRRDQRLRTQAPQPLRLEEVVIAHPTVSECGCGRHQGRDQKTGTLSYRSYKNRTRRLLKVSSSDRNRTRSPQINRTHRRDEADRYRQTHAQGYAQIKSCVDSYKRS